MGLSRGVKGCIGKYLAVELLMKTARPDAMDIGLLLWQFGGDTCLILPVLKSCDIASQLQPSGPIGRV